MAKIAIYVQHLLGAGHLVRAMSLAEALSVTGHNVLLLSGGFPIERKVTDYEIFQLPPTKAVEGNYRNLVDKNYDPIDDSWREKRASVLLGTIQRFSPQLVITETFPFGRKYFRFELEPLIDWIKDQNSVRLLASIRDILQRRSHKKNRIAVKTIHEYYDGILVHADETLFSLDASFELCHEIEHKLLYTGYIHEPPQAIHSSKESIDGYNEIIVSGGSGDVSSNLIETTLKAIPLSKAKFHTWRLLTGRSNNNTFHSTKSNIIIEPNRTDYLALLSRCSLSVSQAGYNTSMDILSSHAKSLMIPFVGDGETEQNDRAIALQQAGRLIQLAESELTPKNLATAIDKALYMTPKHIEVNVNGAANSAKIITDNLKTWKTDIHV